MALANHFGILSTRLINRISCIARTSLRCQSTKLSPQPSIKPKQPSWTSYNYEDCEARRQWLEEETGVDLQQLEGWSEFQSRFSTQELSRHIEMPLGMARIPIAPVGPLNIRGEYVNENVVLPMATLEGALTASTQRGCTAVNLAGGVKTKTGQQRMTSSPLFITGSPLQAALLGEWAKDNRLRMQQEVVSQMSDTAHLIGIIDAYDVDAVHLLLQIQTGDEAGQQLAAQCSAAISKWIIDTARKEIPKSQLQIQKHFAEGNMCSSGKASTFNAATGRGIHAFAECLFPEAVLNKVLNTTAAEMEYFMFYSIRNSQRTGMLCCSANPANLIASNFAATGNNYHCVGESAHGAQVEMKEQDGGLYMSMTLPSLVIGTVGEGTILPTQAACLDMMDCRGEGKVQRYAEIVVGYCLALDVSTLSAICMAEFASAHDSLGRNRPGEK